MLFVEKCQFGAWSDWSSCQNNEQKRTREVNIIEKLSFNLNCIKRRFDIQYFFQILEGAKIEKCMKRSTNSKKC